MYAREVSEYFTAKRKAAKQVAASDRIRDLPSNREIREHILLLAELMEGEGRARELRAMRLTALRFMRLLERWKPKIIGSVLTGHVRKGSDIDLHVFCDSAELVAEMIEQEGYACEVERKRVLKHHQERVFTHVYVEAAYSLELTVYPADKVNFVFNSSITGKAIERADARQLEEVLKKEDPECDLEGELVSLEMAEVGAEEDVWAHFEVLLKALESVKQNPKYHPEGDALFHSLQVYTLARCSWNGAGGGAGVFAFDQEFLLAALLHDVGKAIDPGEHVGAGVEALRGYVSERTLWLVEHHMEAHAYREGTLGHRARRRLAESEHFEELLLLSELDEAGRVPGMMVPTVVEVLAELKAMEEE